MQNVNVHSNHQFQSGQNDYWLKFTASDTIVDIILQKANSNPQASIGTISLYSNTCSNLQLEANLNVSSTDSTLYYSSLTISNDYYLKVSSSTGNPEYFGIYLSSPCANNQGLSCPLPDCDLSSGIYLYRIKTNNTTETGKFIIY